jgi:hypothetical protein
MRSITSLRRWHSTCRCGHHREDHQHYRRGADCALCTCTRFRLVSLRRYRPAARRTRRADLGPPPSGNSLAPGGAEQKQPVHSSGDRRGESVNIESPR